MEAFQLDMCRFKFARLAPGFWDPLRYVKTLRINYGGNAREDLIGSRSYREHRGASDRQGRHKTAEKNKPHDSRLACWSGRCISLWLCGRLRGLHNGSGACCQLARSYNFKSKNIRANEDGSRLDTGDVRRRFNNHLQGQMYVPGVGASSARSCEKKTRERDRLINRDS